MKTFYLHSALGTPIKTKQDIPNQLDVSGEELEISDGYHTMHELYEHRMALNVALFNMIATYRKYPGGPEVFKSKLHNDGTMFEDYFIVSYAYRRENQISYHYKLKHWDLFKIPEIDKIPWEYDGHTSQDVIERLLKL